MYSEAQKVEIIKKYTSEMEVIKLRTTQIFTALSKFEYLEPAVEYKALQLRKIIEQIILASLITNADEYKAQYNRLEKEWNAKNIIRDLERLNPDFFPRPVMNRTDYIIEDKQPVISSQQMVDAYKKMGKYLHSKNPFDTARWDYREVSDFIDDFTRRIIYTLNNHNVTLLGGDVFLNVVMEAEDKNGHVSVLWAEKCSVEEQKRADQLIKDQILKNHGSFEQSI